MRLNASREGVSGQVSPAGLRAVTEGIDPYTVFRHLKVEMGSGGVSGGAGDADDIALTYCPTLTFRLDIWAYSVVLPLP